MKIVILAGCALLVGCSGADSQKEARIQAGQQALESVIGSKLLAVCGPFAAKGAVQNVDLPGTGKFVAFTMDARDTLKISEPFKLKSNPPVVSDGTMVGTDGAGKPIPVSSFAHNTILKTKVTTPLGVAFVAAVHDVDAQGAPDFDRQETYDVALPKVGNRHATATVAVAPSRGTFEADCD